MHFRQHRGSLEDSMTTLVHLKNRDELIGYIKGLLWEYPTAPPVTDETVEVKFYMGDPRIGWTQLHIVTLDGYGVLGFTDGPCPPILQEVKTTDQSKDKEKNTEEES